MKIGDLVEMCDSLDSGPVLRYYGMGLIDKMIDLNHYSVDWIILPWAEVKYLPRISKDLLREIK